MLQSPVIASSLHSGIHPTASLSGDCFFLELSNQLLHFCCKHAHWQDNIQNRSQSYVQQVPTPLLITNERGGPYFFRPQRIDLAALDPISARAIAKTSLQLDIAGGKLNSGSSSYLRESNTHHSDKTMP